MNKVDYQLTVEKHCEIADSLSDIGRTHTDIKLSSTVPRWQDADMTL